MSYGGKNSPAINSVSYYYDRHIAFDAPVAFDGLYVHPTKTLSELRADLMALLGFAAMSATPPPGMTNLLNLWLNLAQSQQYYRYDVLRTEQWWPWQLQAGVRFYDTPIDGNKPLNFRKITWAGLSDNGGVAYRMWTADTALALKEFILIPAGSDLIYEVTVAGTTGPAEPVWPTLAGQTVVNGTVTFTARERHATTWMPLVQGINPVLYTDSSRSIPTHYDVREYLEVFPTPDQPYVLWLKGHMGLKRFSEDTDEATIDHEIVLLFAAAMGKAHYRQPDANNYAQMCARMTAELTAASHGTRRYLSRPSTLGMRSDFCGDDTTWPQPKATWR